MGLLSYAVARTTWTLADVLVYPHGVPFPSMPDVFFILQYPFFVAMAATIMFGLSFACVLTMIVVPVLYSFFFSVPTRAQAE